MSNQMKTLTGALIACVVVGVSALTAGVMFGSSAKPSSAVTTGREIVELLLRAEPKLIGVNLSPEQYEQARSVLKTKAECLKQLADVEASGLVRGTVRTVGLIVEVTVREDQWSALNSERQQGLRANVQCANGWLQLIDGKIGLATFNLEVHGNMTKKVLYRASGAVLKTASDKVRETYRDTFDRWWRKRTLE
jgi:hypothetical protein